MDLAKRNRPQLTGASALEQFDISTLEQIVSTLQAQFIKRACPEVYCVRLLSIGGEVGHRCITFNIDLIERSFLQDWAFLENLVQDTRNCGYEVDELLQRISRESAYELRYWIIVYESTLLRPTSG